MKRVVVTYKDGLGNIHVHEIEAKDKFGELVVYPTQAGGFAVHESLPNHPQRFRSQWSPGGYIMVEEQDYISQPDSPEDNT